MPFTFCSGQLILKGDQAVFRENVICKLPQTERGTLSPLAPAVRKPKILGVAAGEERGAGTAGHIRNHFTDV